MFRILYHSWLARRIQHHQSAITAEFACPRIGMADRITYHRRKIRQLSERKARARRRR